MNGSRAVLAEFLGTALLLVVVVGSGIMGENLSQGNLALALLANSIATGAGLYVLIQMFTDISGAHFNPAVSFVEWRRKKIDTSRLLQYLGAQFVGAVSGVVITHAMFGQSILQISIQNRSEFRFYFSEVVAAFGLVLVILLTSKREPKITPGGVALYITSAYWFTSSTSFANPAVTLGRMFTDTFSGIGPEAVLPFIGAQLTGAALALLVAKTLEPIN